MICSVIVGCDRKSPTVHYVIPDGFRGAFVIYVSDPNGIDLKQAAGVYTCVIPESGVLRIKGKGPFHQWHGTTASFAGGETIPIADEPNEVPDGIVAFWHGGRRLEGGSAYDFAYDFIGTKEEHLIFKKATAMGAVEAGGVRGNGQGAEKGER